MSLAILLVLIACAIAVITDLHARRVPNWLTAALALAALVLHGIHGALAFAISLGTLVAVLGAGFVLFSFGWLGGGDVKLLAAGAAALGLPDAISFLIYTALGGGILAVTIAVATGRLRVVLTSAALLLRPLAYLGTTAPSGRPTIALPYAVAIAFGAVTVALSHNAAPFLRLPL